VRSQFITDQSWTFVSRLLVLQIMIHYDLNPGLRVVLHYFGNGTEWLQCGYHWWTNKT